MAAGTSDAAVVMSGAESNENGPSPNGRHPRSAWTRLRVDRASAGHCRVTFHRPPAGTVTAPTVAELAELVNLIGPEVVHDIVTLLEAAQSPDIRVIVFDSADPDFFLVNHDVADDPAGWLEVLMRLSRAPVVSIASIRGRARGAAGEFVLACDLRFASRENTVLGSGIGGGAVARLARLVGRARALEILFVAGDLDGPRAERYGYVNRLFADDRLDEEVDHIATRLARFDHEAIRRVKSSVDT
jgi:enoyl-CoA hydratase/carnithine racemase